MSTDPESPLLIEERGGVAWLTMNRPERLNAMNPALVDALRHYFQALPGRRDLRVVVLQGAGRAYCAGLDLKHTAELMGSGQAKTLDDSFATQYSIKDIMLAMRRCPQPVISVVQGSASDIRIATPEARFNAAFIDGSGLAPPLDAPSSWCIGAATKSIPCQTGHAGGQWRYADFPRHSSRPCCKGWAAGLRVRLTTDVHEDASISVC